MFTKSFREYCVFTAFGIRASYSGRVNANTGGIIFNCGISGLYWSAGPSGTSTYVRLIDFTPDHVYPQNIDRRDYGATLRPVPE